MAKIELNLFTEAYTEKLHRDVKVTSNVENYMLEKFPYEDRFPKGPTGIFIDESFDLNPENTDVENSIALYEELSLDDTQASDPRLWSFLTHVYFWKYMRGRWSLQDVRKGDSPAGRVMSRYTIISATLESLTRNGISRLWWYSHLTRDHNRSDKYELTKILLKRAEVAVGVMERFVGSNPNTRTAVLEFLKENADILDDEARTRKLLRNFNLYGGSKVLPILGVPRIKEVLQAIAR